MCDEYDNIILTTNDNSGEITIKIKSEGIWNALSEYEREMIIKDRAYWGIVEDALKYKIGRSLSTPNFNSSLHKLRELICTDTEFLSEIVVAFVKQLLEEWANVEQDRRASVQAYWKLYHKVKECERDTRYYNCIKSVTPNDIKNSEKGEYLRVSSDDVREDILKKFYKLLAQSAPHNY